MFTIEHGVEPCYVISRTMFLQSDVGGFFNADDMKTVDKVLPFSQDLDGFSSDNSTLTIDLSVPR